MRAAIVLVGLIGIMLAACKPAPQQQAAPPPASVVVAPVVLQDLSSERTFTGRIEAIDKVQIRARVQGFLKSRKFEEGSEVKKGDLLFEIEPEPFAVAVDQAHANVVSAGAGLTLAEQTFARTDDLASRNTATKASLDQARSSLAQAQAAVQAREADLRTAELNLSYTKIAAPMDGRVGRAAYSIGNLVGTDSSPLATLVAQDPVYVTFPVPQWLLIQVRKTGEGPSDFVVKLQLADGTRYEPEGVISFADVQASASTDSVLVRAKMPNPKRLLVDQQLVTVLVVSKKPDQKLMISQSAMLLDQQGAYVMAVGADNKVQIKRFTSGEQRGPSIVVESGLAKDERVIVSGHQKARPGDVVAPQLAEPMPAAVRK